MNSFSLQNDTLALVAPSEEWLESVALYREEFGASGDTMDGSGCLEGDTPLEAWLARVRQNSRKETVQAGLVPATTLLAVRRADAQLVGMVDIRHRLNDSLLRYGGHIGYSVRPAERRKGYAKQMLALALQYCREALLLERALVTCNETNTASRRTIEAAGGLLENAEQQEGRVTLRFWIPL